MKSSSRNTIAAFAVLVPVIAIVVYSSFQVSAVECEVCMAFEGREMCRTVSAADREQALRSAIDNACAFLTSGMTSTLQCTGREPRRAECRSVASAE
ncbi:MAG: hypothetical protein ACREQQ_07850 [Candidatus Binatia bacterium]